MDLKPEWIRALEHMRTLYGRQWKYKLAIAWTESLFPRDADLSAALRQMRNQLGPTWLAAYRVGDTSVGWVARGEVPMPLPGPTYRRQRTWRITHPDGTVRVQAEYTTKAEMLKGARQLKITLIEDHLP